MKSLIASQTTTATSDPINIYEGQGYNYPAFPVAVWAWDLAPGETVKVQFPTDKAAPDDWEDMYILTSDVQQVAIYAPVRFRVVKSVTFASVGVAMSEKRGM